MTKNELRSANLEELQKMPKEFKDIHSSIYENFSVLSQEHMEHSMLAAVRYLRVKLVEALNESTKSVRDTKGSSEGTGTGVGKEAAKAGGGSSKAAGKGK